MAKMTRLAKAQEIVKWSRQQAAVGQDFDHMLAVAIAAHLDAMEIKMQGWGGRLLWLLGLSYWVEKKHGRTRRAD